MVHVVELSTADITVTPFFDLRRLENVPKSEEAGMAVYDMVEVVQIRFAGSNLFSPVFPTDAMWKREGNRIVTYMERWPEEYRRFKSGEAQEARGTPLEMLTRFGVTPEMISLCRTMRVYSIEALHHLEGDGKKALGMHVNTLKDAAAEYMAERMSSKDAADRIAALEAQIAALTTKSTEVPKLDSTPQEIKAALSTYADIDTRDLVVMLESRTGQKPTGKPDRLALIQMLETLDLEKAG